MSSGTVVHFENSINVSKIMSVENQPVLQAAFYDIFEHKEVLEEFVRNIADGDVRYPQDEAEALLLSLDKKSSDL